MTAHLLKYLGSSATTSTPCCSFYSLRRGCHTKNDLLIPGFGSYAKKTTPGNLVEKFSLIERYVVPCFCQGFSEKVESKAKLKLN